MLRIRIPESATLVDNDIFMDESELSVMLLGMQTVGCDTCKHFKAAQRCMECEDWSEYEAR